MPLVLSVGAGIVTGAFAWWYTGYRAGAAAWFARFPRWFGVALGALCGIVSGLISHEGLLIAPLVTLFAVMAVSDLLALRVYDGTSFAALAYAVLVAAIHGQIVWALLGDLIFGLGGLIFALIMRPGVADVIGFAALGAVAGHYAYMLVMLTLLLAIAVMVIRRNATAPTAMFPGMLISVLAWYAGMFIPLERYFA